MKEVLDMSYGQKMIDTLQKNELEEAMNYFEQDKNKIQMKNFIYWQILFIN